MSFLNTLLDAIGYTNNQPQQAVPSTPVVSDAFARAHGFPNAIAMQGFYANRQRNLTGTSGGPSPSSGAALAIHPAILLKSILDKWNKADGTSP